MKTNQLMIRKMGDFEVIQRTGDGFFDGNFLLSQWNKSNDRKRIDKFLNNSSTIEFISTLENDKSQWSKNTNGENRAVIKSNGRNTKSGRTSDRVYMHPLLFIDFAMWINPSFKLQVLKFVFDQMIEYRNNAGDAYVKLAASISKIVNKDFMPRAMSKIGEALNYITFNEHEKNLRNKFGEESKLRELYMLENKVSELIDEGFITTYDNLIKYLRNLYFKRYTPEIFTTN